MIQACWFWFDSLNVFIRLWTTDDEFHNSLFIQNLANNSPQKLWDVLFVLALQGFSLGPVILWCPADASFLAPVRDLLELKCMKMRVERAGTTQTSLWTSNQELKEMTQTLFMVFLVSQLDVDFVFVEAPCICFLMFVSLLWWKWELQDLKCYNNNNNSSNNNNNVHVSHGSDWINLH